MEVVLCKKAKLRVSLAGCLNSEPLQPGLLQICFWVADIKVRKELFWIPTCRHKVKLFIVGMCETIFFFEMGWFWVRLPQLDVFLKVRSHLPVFCIFSQAKPSQFNGNTLHRYFHVRTKDFLMLISQMVQVGLTHSPHLSTESCFV